MKTLKRAFLGSFLALSMLAVPAAAAVADRSDEAEASKGTPVLVYCLSCGTHHLIEI